MQNHISMDCRTVALLLALTGLAGCATEPAPIQVSAATPAPVEAAPEEATPVETTAMPESATAEPEAAEVPDVPDVPVTDAIVAGQTSTGEAADPDVNLRPDAPLRYIVQRGDTLWSISQKFLLDSWQWPELWFVNPKVRNPHLIYPGDELLLYFSGGRPVLARAGEGPSDAGGDGPADEAPVRGGDETLSPRVRELALDQAVYSIPLDAIRAFLRGPRVVEEDILEDAPYVIDFDEERLLGGEGNIAYVLQLDEKPLANYQVVRRGEEQVDPDDGDTIGFEVLPVGEAEVRVVADPSTVKLTRTTIETRAGDYLLPLETEVLADRFVPHAPEKKIDGRIISVYNGVSQIGQWQVVAINRGTQHGLEPGHVLQVLQSGRESKDPYSFFSRSVQLPEVPAGTAMVFKTGPRLSYALVMSALRAIHIRDRVEKPEPSE